MGNFKIEMVLYHFILALVLRSSVIDHTQSYEQKRPSDTIMYGEGPKLKSVGNEVVYRMLCTTSFFASFLLPSKPSTPPTVVYFITKRFPGLIN